MGGSSSSYKKHLSEQRMADLVADRLVDIQILQRRTKANSKKNQKQFEDLLKKVQIALSNGETERADAIAQAAAVRQKRAVDLAYADAALESIRAMAENCVQEHIATSSINDLTEQLSAMSKGNGDITTVAKLLKKPQENIEPLENSTSIIEWVKANTDSNGEGFIPAPPAVSNSELMKMSTEARAEKILREQENIRQAEILKASLPCVPTHDPLGDNDTSKLNNDSK